MKRIILDTDIGGDCDDTGALAILLNAEREKFCEIYGITVSTANPYSPACTDAINRYYGRGDIPIGQTLKAAVEDDPQFYEVCYGKKIAEKFPNDYLGKKPQDAVKMLRKLLAESDCKCTIAAIGNLINLGGLLDSFPDDYSPLTGIELVRQKVEEIAVMGCFFPTDEVPEVRFGNYVMRAEFNIKCDIPSARKVFSKCPVKITVSHYLLGWQLITGKKLLSEYKKNPVAASYKIHSDGGRDSWDPITVFYAIFGESDLFIRSNDGCVTIDEDGVSKFTEREGGLHRLLEIKNRERAAEKIDDAISGVFS